MRSNQDGPYTAGIIRGNKLHHLRSGGPKAALPQWTKRTTAEAKAKEFADRSNRREPGAVPVIIGAERLPEIIGAEIMHSSKPDLWFAVCRYENIYWQIVSLHRDNSDANGERSRMVARDSSPDYVPRYEVFRATLGGSILIYEIDD